MAAFHLDWHRIFGPGGVLVQDVAALSFGRTELISALEAVSKPVGSRDDGGLWLRIKVDLLGGGGIECKPTPGRIFIVGPGHSFGDLAAAIDAAFARWDLSHLHGSSSPTAA